MKLFCFLLFFVISSTSVHAQGTTLQFPFDINFSPTDARLQRLKIKEIKQVTIYQDSLNGDTLSSYIDYLFTYDSLSVLTSLRWNFRQEYFDFYPRQAIGGPILTNTVPVGRFSFGNTHLYLNPDDSAYYNFVEERYFWKKKRIQRIETFYPKTEADVDIPSEYHLEMQMAGYLPFVTLDMIDTSSFPITITTSDTRKTYENGHLSKEEILIDGKSIRTIEYHYQSFKLEENAYFFPSKIVTKSDDYVTVSYVAYTFYE